MKPKKNSSTKRAGVVVDALVRHIFSVNVPEDDLAKYMEETASRHPRGMSGWIRDLVEADRVQRQRDLDVASKAMTKLTSEERRAIASAYFQQSRETVQIGKHVFSVPNSKV
jgi:hypothetical protein